MSATWREQLRKEVAACIEQDAIAREITVKGTMAGFDSNQDRAIREALGSRNDSEFCGAPAGALYLKGNDINQLNTADFDEPLDLRWSVEYTFVYADFSASHRPLAVFDALP